MSNYAPDFRIEINGEPVPAVLRGHVTRISYQNGIKGADRVEVSIANPNLRWLDHPLLALDNRFSLWLGYAPDPLEQMFVGEITGTNASFPNGGMPTLTLVAHDLLQRMSIGSKNRAFKINVPTVNHLPLDDLAVISAVGAMNGLIPAVDPTGAALSFLTYLLGFAAGDEAKKGVRIQEGVSDFEFLSQLASENGLELYIDHTAEPKGYVMRLPFMIRDFSPSLSLKWGESLLDFSPNLTNVGQVAAVTSRIWLPSIQKEIVIVLSWNFDRASFDLMVYPDLGEIEEVVGVEKAKKTIKVDANGPVSAPKEILSELLPRLNNRLTGSGSCLGDLRIRAGRIIQLEGLGIEFSGLYRITSATHSLESSGYRTSFEARKEVWFGSVPLPRGAEGLLHMRQ